MAVTVKSILEHVRVAGASTPPETITYLGLLLERDAMKRYDDPIYAQLHFPPGWLELKLSRVEFEEIVEVLANVLEQHPKLASTAAFALGKAYSDLAVPRLIAALGSNWQTDDELAYQLLIALDNHGIAEAADLVRRIAKDGPKKSREFACDLVRLGLV
jgi:hypothetical protein